MEPVFRRSTFFPPKRRSRGVYWSIFAPARIGEQSDPESHLYYLRARYLDSLTGRFLNVDPLASQGERPYLYAGADPVNGEDPTGQQNIIEYTLLLMFAQPFHVTFHIGCGMDMQTNGGNSYVAIKLMNSMQLCESSGSSGGGGGGGGSGPPPPPDCKVSKVGLAVGTRNLQTLAGGGFKSKPLCMSTLRKLMITTLTSQSPQHHYMSNDQFAAAISSAASHACVLDGPCSHDPLTQQSFPNAAPGPEVRDWFGGHGTAQALSQFDGPNIYIRSFDWESDPRFSGSYGLGTLMHEILHKQEVNGGYSHAEMNYAFGIACPTCAPAGVNADSQALANECF